jgi:multimeric flavodoxin WrbA
VKALVLDGSRVDDAAAPRVCGATEEALRAGGWDVEVVTLRDKRIGNCAGDFYCWIRSPGVCNVNDDNRAVAAAIVSSDLLVYLSPVTFGGYSSVLKGMVDHQIQILSPDFARIDGETHHRKRYAAYPDLLAIGWLDEPDPDAEAIFATLAGRNAVNLHSSAAAAGVVHAAMPDDAVRRAVAGWLDALAGGGRTRRVALRPAAGEPVDRPPRRAVLLVGSPRTRASTSHSLGSYLLGRLGEQGIAADTIQLHTLTGSTVRLDAAIELVEASDLVVLAAPLYVDALPAPVVRVLERLAARRASSRSAARAQFAAIVNCGFPEAAHNATAIAICAQFAREVGFAWAGGLALGGGEGLVHGAALASLGGRAGNVTRSLDLAADALARGEPISDAARELMARPFVPPWLYRAVGGLGWRLQARRWGAARSMGRRPYARPTDAPAPELQAR